MKLLFKISFIVNYELNDDFTTPDPIRQQLSMLEAYIIWMKKQFDFQFKPAASDISDEDTSDYCRPLRQQEYHLIHPVSSFHTALAYENLARGFALLFQDVLSIRVEAKYIDSKNK